MIKVAIVEDDGSYVEVIVGYLKKYEVDSTNKFHIEIFRDGLDIISDYRAEYDIIFLDIQMKHMDGMETAQKIRKIDEGVIIIFITSSVQFAVQGYLVDAIGYVVKPVSYFAFSQILDKAIKKYSKKISFKYMSIDVEGGQIRFELKQIYYVESQRHHVIMHTEKGEFLTSGPLKKYEERLHNEGFAKCHNSYLLNLEHVMGIVKDNVAMTNQSTLPISRTKKKKFMDDLADYIGGISV